MYLNNFVLKSFDITFIGEGILYYTSNNVIKVKDNQLYIEIHVDFCSGSTECTLLIPFKKIPKFYSKFRMDQYIKFDHFYSFVKNLFRKHVVLYTLREPDVELDMNFIIHVMALSFIQLSLKLNMIVEIESETIFRKEFQSSSYPGSIKSYDWVEEERLLDSDILNGDQLDDFLIEV